MSIKKNVNIGIFESVKCFSDIFNGTIEENGRDYTVVVDTEKCFVSLIFIGNNLPCNIKIIGKNTGRIVNLMSFTDETIKKVVPCKTVIEPYYIEYTYCEIHDIYLFESRTFNKPIYKDCTIYLYKNDLEKFSKDRLFELAVYNTVKIEVNPEEYPEINLFDITKKSDETHYFINYFDWHK